MKRILLPLMLLLTITAYGQQRLRVSILGDSYSTYQNYIPEGNEPWYFEPFRPDMTDVKDVRQIPSVILVITTTIIHLVLSLPVCLVWALPILF